MAPTQVLTTIISLLDFISLLVNFLPQFIAHSAALEVFGKCSSDHVTPPFKTFQRFPISLRIKL